MKFSLGLILLVTVAACASKRPESVQTTEQATKEANAQSLPIAFEGHCGMGLCMKQKVKGEEKYGIDYKGKRYLFSSEKARDQFQKNIENNITTANKQWTAMGAERAR